MVAVCTAGGVDIGEWMVRQGYAVDWPKYSAGFYARAETEARTAKRGLGWIVRPALGMAQADDGELDLSVLLTLLGGHIALGRRLPLRVGAGFSN